VPVYHTGLPQRTGDNLPTTPGFLLVTRPLLCLRGHSDEISGGSDAPRQPRIRTVPGPLADDPIAGWFTRWWRMRAVPTLPCLPAERLVNQFELPPPIWLKVPQTTSLPTLFVPHRNGVPDGAGL